MSAMWQEDAESIDQSQFSPKSKSLSSEDEADEFIEDLNWPINSASSFQVCSPQDSQLLAR